MKNLYIFLLLPVLLSGCNMTDKELEDFTKSMNEFSGASSSKNGDTSFHDQAHQNFMFQEQNRIFQEQVNTNTMIQQQLINQQQHQPF